MAWSSRKNFQLIFGVQEKRKQKEKYVDNLLPVLYLVRLVGAFLEIGGQEKRIEKKRDHMIYY